MKTEQLNGLNAQKAPPSNFFYVVIPPEDQAISNDTSKLVHSSSELTAIMKRNPRARFMTATTAEEAMQKALDKIQFTRDTESIVSPPPKPTPKKRGRQSFSAVEASIGAPAIESPKTGELLMMGREILSKKNDQVFERIEKNPRILCTDSEFPTILQEGCKYNAVHLAAKSNNFHVLKHVLNLASNMDFIKRIYPYQNEESLISSCKHLVNCYLNSPDKMSQETPLHFACKFNAVESVEILLCHPFCDLTLQNFESMTAFEVIGSRDEPKGAKASAIRKLFSQRFIVPVWRDMAVDGDPPFLGEVCYIPDLGQAIPEPLLKVHFPDFSMQLLDPCKPNLAPKTSSSSLRVFISQPISWKVQAYAGPIEESKANEFRKIMKKSRFFLYGFPSCTPESSFNHSDNMGNGDLACATPPRISPVSPPQSGNLLLTPIKSPMARRSFCESPALNSPLKTDMAVRVRDVEKGLERIASEYCVEMGIPWTEYWKFLGNFCDLSSESGLDLLEAHFRVLETKKRETQEEDHSVEQINGSRSFTLDDVIYKMQEIRLSESGMTTPDKDNGNYCTNPNCRTASRFCNCEDVVPNIPYQDEDDDFDPVVFTYGEDLVRGIPFTPGNDDVLHGIRKFDISSNSDSFSLSNPTHEDAEFEWPFLQLGVETVDCYKTAPSSPVQDLEKDVFEECNAIEIYLSGNEPGKLDFQVFQFLRDMEVQVDAFKHLLTFQWLNSMRSYGRKILTALHAPLNGTPRKPWGPSFISTPRRGQNHSLDFDFSF